MKLQEAIKRMDSYYRGESVGIYTENNKYSTEEITEARDFLDKTVDEFDPTLNSPEDVLQIMSWITALPRQLQKDLYETRNNIKYGGILSRTRKTGAHIRDIINLSNGLKLSFIQKYLDILSIDDIIQIILTGQEGLDKSEFKDKYLQMEDALSRGIEVLKTTDKYDENMELLYSYLVHYNGALCSKYPSHIEMYDISELDNLILTLTK